jgi:hypothetical protein
MITKDESRIIRFIDSVNIIVAVNPLQYNAKLTANPHWNYEKVTKFKLLSDNKINFESCYFIKSFFNHNQGRACSSSLLTEVFYSDFVVFFN